ncbi:MAG: PilZ domain-containing protein [Candidatus Manganitrophaceae bacterium]|nr:MAG: PilZ domain-containing protein [Candidatus Manganitrophaceae bacterium]
MLTSEEKTKVNRRQSSRLPFIVLEVKGKHSNKVFVAYAENISQGGLFLSSSHKLKVGDRFPIEFILPDNKTKVRCTCEVTWKKKYDTQGIISEGVGVRFVDLASDQKKIITGWIDKEEKKKRGS